MRAEGVSVKEQRSNYGKNRYRRFKDMTPEEVIEREMKKRKSIDDLNAKTLKFVKQEANRRFRERDKSKEWDELVKELLEANSKIITLPSFKASFLKTLNLRQLKNE